MLLDSTAERKSHWRFFSRRDTQTYLSIYTYSDLHFRKIPLVAKTRLDWWGVHWRFPSKIQEKVRPFTTALIVLNVCLLKEVEIF